MDPELPYMLEREKLIVREKTKNWKSDFSFLGVGWQKLKGELNKWNGVRLQFVKTRLCFGDAGVIHNYFHAVWGEFTTISCYLKLLSHCFVNTCCNEIHRRKTHKYTDCVRIVGAILSERETIFHNLLVRKWLVQKPLYFLRLATHSVNIVFNHFALGCSLTLKHICATHPFAQVRDD